MLIIGCIFVETKIYNMKLTGRASRYDEVEQDPSIPFINDIKKDMDVINTHYTILECIDIKKKMIQTILDSI